MQRINMLHQALPPTCYGGAGGGRGVVLHLEARTIAHTRHTPAVGVTLVIWCRLRWWKMVARRTCRCWCE